MPEKQKPLTQKEFIAKLKAEVPELASFKDDVLMEQVFKRRPELREQIENPMYGDRQALAAQNKAEARSKSLIDPEFWKNHPNAANLSRKTLDTLPAIGSITGGMIASPETFGAGSIPGMALGAGAGRGLRDIITSLTGLEEPKSPMEAGRNIALDSAFAALTPGVMEASMHPVDAARLAASDYSTLLPRRLRPYIEPKILEDFAKGGGSRRTPIMTPDYIPTNNFPEIGEVVPDPQYSIARPKALPPSNVFHYGTEGEFKPVVIHPSELPPDLVVVGDEGAFNLVRKAEIPNVEDAIYNNAREKFNMGKDMPLEAPKNLRFQFGKK